MCTIAAYIGTERAAPILIDMMRKLEGLDSGFYTGIATMHNGRIYHAKVAGDLERLLAATDAASLPGTIGFIHSRTPSKEKSDFAGVAHPFTAEREGSTQTALILNGAGGIFGETIRAKIPHAAQTVLSQGYTLKSAHPAVGNVTMPDGSKVHSNDVRCQMIDRRISEGEDAAFALQEVFTDIPAEAVCLLLSLSEPDAVCFARLNFPMHLTFGNNCAYMSTAPLAFPENAGDYLLLPTMSYGKVFKNRFEAAKFLSPPATVAPITPKIAALAYEYMENRLRITTTFNDTGLSEYLKPLYPPADTDQWATVRYQAVSELERQGRVQTETRYIEGQTENLRAPVFYLTLREGN